MKVRTLLTDASPSPAGAMRIARATGTIDAHVAGVRLEPVRPARVRPGSLHPEGDAAWGLQIDARTDTIRDVLSLAQTTSSTWLAAALDALDVILLDHAHCEKKAASTAVGFLFRYPERTAMAQVMSRLAREELVHFERVLGELGRREIAFRRLPPSPYGAELYKQVRSWQPAKLMDELLVSALIEARSCERFALLAEAVNDPVLAALYRDLGPAEERHTELYVELACEVAPRAEVSERARFLAGQEAEIVAAPGAALRLHAG